MALLEVENLVVRFRNRAGVVPAVNGVSFSVDAGETVGPTTRLLLPGRDKDVADTPPRSPTYVIRAGDTPTSIARASGISLAELKRMNPKLDPKRLKPGVRLRVGVAD